MKRKILIGNWKMNKSMHEAIEFSNAVKEKAKEVESKNIILGIAPGYLCLPILKKLAAPVLTFAQNVHYEESGAYTGEVSIPMLEEIGVRGSLVGHSERRQYFNETNHTCNLKLKALEKHNMNCVYCVGETLDEREKGITAEIITSQTRLALEGLTDEQVKNTIIAYEPIWAIGTGKTATSEDANNSIIEIRKEIEKIYGKDVADCVIIQYGGSVKSSNAKELFNMSDIDGGLVGGASLKPDEFAKIVNYNA